MADLAQYEVSVESDADAVQRLLASGGLRGTPFQTPAWLREWFGVYQPEGIDCIVGVIRRRGDPRPLLLLPLVRERRHGLRVLTLPDRGVSDYHAALVSDDFAPDRATADRLWNALAGELPPADLLAIERMLPASAARMGLDHRSRRSPFTAHAMPLDADFATLRERRFDPSTGRRLVRNRRKLEHKGPLSFDFITGPDAIADLDRLLGWRRQRFQEFNDPAGEAIQSDFYHRLLLEGSLARVGRLRLNGEMIGGCLGVVDDGRILLLAVAYDLHFANWAPGLLTLESCLAEAVRLGLTVFDLTIGDESYKKVFGVETIDLLECRMPLTLRGRVTLAALGLKPLAKRLLEQLGLLRLLRRHTPRKMANARETADES